LDIPWKKKGAKNTASKVFSLPKEVGPPH